MRLPHPPSARRPHHQRVPARDARVPDPVVLQLIAGLASRRVVRVIVVLLCAPWLPCSALRGSPFWKRLQVSAAAVERLPEVLHRRGRWQLLSHFRRPTRRGTTGRWARPPCQSAAPARRPAPPQLVAPLIPTSPLRLPRERSCQSTC